MSISNVILIGANGKWGTSILSALQSASFNVSVLSRTSSKSIYPSDVRVIQTSDDPSVNELIPLLRYQDAVVFEVGEQKARLFDDGDIRWSATTIGTIAKAVVGILKNPDVTKNRMLYIQSFCISQNDVLKSLQKFTQGDWQTRNVDSEVYIEELKAELDKYPDNHEANENLVSVVGIIDANWEKKGDFANELLGIGGEDLDQVVRTFLAE